jgi:hypothetical protein
MDVPQELVLLYMPFGIMVGQMLKNWNMTEWIVPINGFVGAIIGTILAYQSNGFVEIMDVATGMMAGLSATALRGGVKSVAKKMNGGT